MKPALEKVESSIVKLHERKQAETANKHPLFGILANLHRDYLQSKGPLSDFCKSGTLGLDVWQVSARTAGDKVEWTLELRNGPTQGIKTCKYTGNIPGQTAYSARNNTSVVSGYDQRPKLPIRDRISMNAHGTIKPTSRRKPKIAKPQLPKKDLQRERYLKLIAPTLSAAYHSMTV